MKKLYSILAATTLLIGGATAQTFTIEDDQGTDITNGQITVTDVPGTADVHAYMAVTNNAQTTVNTKIKRYETNVVAGTRNYFCWALCYGEMDAGTNPQFPTPQDSQWSDFLPVPSGYTVPADGNAFAAHHMPQGNVGTSTYRYVVFDGDNESDSVYVDVIFDIATGIEEQKVASFNIEAYPNPATTVANIHYSLDSQTENNKVLLFNMLGAKVKEIKLDDKEGVLKLNTVGLNSGVYFYQLVADGKKLASKKLVISK